ncbi:hypothetical protein ABZW49_04310 [Nonomuraea wenchangensis]
MKGTSVPQHTGRSHARKSNASAQVTGITPDGSNDILLDLDGVNEILPQVRETGRYVAANPQPQLDELDRTIRRAKEQAAVLGNLKGVVDPSWLDAKGRHVAAIALGLEPDVDPATRPLTVGEFLEGRGVTGASLRSISTTFGKRLKALYRKKYGTEPGTVDRFVDGALRPVACYTEAHRDLFDQAWATMNYTH